MHIAWYVVIMVGSVLGIFVPLTIWLNAQAQLDQKLVDSLNLYLLAGFIVEGIVLFFVGDIMQKKRDLQTEKKEHTRDLVQRIYNLLTDIFVREDYRTHKLAFQVYRDPDRYHTRKLNLDLLETDNAVDLMPVDRLPKPYFEWGMKHLEKYPNIIKPWKEANSALDEYNLVNEKIRKTLDDMIKNQMVQSFPSFVYFEPTSHSENIYYPKKMRDKVFEVLGFNMQNKLEWDFEDVIHDRNTIKPKGFGESPYLIGNITESDLDKFRQVLISITNNSELKKQFEDSAKIYDRMVVHLQKFESELETLIAKLNGRMLIEGKCELGY